MRLHECGRLKDLSNISEVKNPILGEKHHRLSALKFIRNKVGYYNNHFK